MADVSLTFRIERKRDGKRRNAFIFGAQVSGVGKTEGYWTILRASGVPWAANVIQEITYQYDADFLTQGLRRLAMGMVGSTRLNGAHIPLVWW
jgi:hypothetical protein